MIISKNLTKAEQYELLRYGYIVNIEKANTNKYRILNSIKNNGITDELTGTMLLKETICNVIGDIAPPITIGLSDGVDSSIMLALAKFCFDSHNIRCITIDNGNVDINAVKRLCNYYGVKLDIRDIIPGDIKKCLDQVNKETVLEPFLSSSIVSTYKLYRSIDTDTIVTGDGGDELFGGYDRYFFNERLHNMSKINKWILRWVAQHFDRVYTKESDRVRKFIETMEMGYSSCMSIWPEQLIKDIGLDEQSGYIPQEKFLLQDYEPYVLKLMVYDYITELIGVEVPKVETAMRMAKVNVVSPFLTPEVETICWKIDFGLKYRNKQRKYILRHMVDKYTRGNYEPSHQKKGFSLPLSDWIKNKGIWWNILSGLHCTYKIDLVAKLVDDHRHGIDRTQQIWSLLWLGKLIEQKII